MSRIGKLPIPLPKGVSVTLDEGRIAVKGPKGQLGRPVVDGVQVVVEGDEILVRRDSDSRHHRAAHGLMRALVNNMVVGVTQGFDRKLEIQGVGYKAEMAGKDLVLHLGYSHPITFSPPEGISISVERNTKLTVAGIDKETVGQVAAVIRGYRPPDSYKGKGVRYDGEVVRLKAGKSAKS